MFNKDNIEGIVFQINNHRYRIGKVNDKHCEVFKIKSNWKDLYYDVYDILKNLNRPNPWKVIEQPSKIYECW